MSIGPDNLFIPRVGFKVNLLVISTDRQDQHIQNWGGAQARGQPAILLHALNNMEKLTYCGPEPSHATRAISRRSRASLRGSMVVKLAGFRSPRIVQFESKLEYDFLCLTAVREDVHHIWDQPPAIQYVSADGRTKQHTFDFLVSLASGVRIAVAIKPMQRVIRRNFITELERVAAVTPKQFADKIILVTDQHLDREAAVAAARKLIFQRPDLTEVAA